jgi:hypothetical protein
VKVEGLWNDGKRNEMVLNELHHEVKLEDVYIPYDDELDKMNTKINYECNLSQILKRFILTTNIRESK